MKIFNYTQHIVTASIFTLLTACSSAPVDETVQRPVSSLDKMIDAAFQQEPVKKADDEKVSDDVSSALLPDINISAPGSGGIDVEPRFDIKVRRQNVRNFFMGLVEDTGYNMVLHPKVRGRITLNLKNVTVQEVMEVVRDVYGYDFEKNKTGFKVFPNTMRTRIFRLNYLDVERQGGSRMSVSSGQVTDNYSSGSGYSSGGYSGSSYSGSGTSGSSYGSNSGQRVSGSSINTISKSDFWKELQESLDALVGKKKGRNVVINAQSGMIIVRALPSELRAVEKLIDDIQDVIQRQVIIEAKILEVELNERYQSGINWSALSLAGANRYQLNQVGGGSIFGGSGVTSIAGNTGDLDPSALSQVNGSSTSAFGGMFSLALNIGSGFSAFIELLKTQGDVHVLSSPQVSTVNNQKAVIKVGTDEFFITDVQNNTSTTTSVASTQSNVRLTPFFSGVALDVIPQISKGGKIILHVHPSVSNVSEKVKDISVSSTSTLSVPLAISSIRESDSIISAKSGQIVVIGGLMQNTTEQRESKVPLLGDIPLVGSLFRHSQEIKKKSELVILLKPIVVDSDKTMNNYVDRIKTRFSNKMH